MAALPKPKVTAISFGSSAGWLAYSNRVLSKFSACHANIFQVNTKTYCMDDLPDWIHALPDATRGYKYWVWKPYVILDALLRAEENEIIFYTDGRSDIDGPLPWLHTFAEGENDVLACQMEIHMERKWTNGDIFNKFGVEFDSDVATSGQIMSGMAVFRKSVASVQFLCQWLEFIRTNYVMCSMAPSKLPNHSSFCENRNDQSVLSLLLKTKSIPNLKLTLILYNRDLAPLRTDVFPHC